MNSVPRSDSESPRPAPPRRGAGREFVVALAVVLLAITAFWFGPASRVAERRKQQDLEREAATDALMSPAGRAAGRVLAPRPLRVALLSLPADGVDTGSRAADLLAALATELGTLDESRLGVVGPLLDGPLLETLRPLTEIGAQLGADYVVAVEIDADGDTLAQLVAVPGGELLFTTRFPAAAQAETMREPIAAGVIAAIEQARNLDLR